MNSIQLPDLTREAPPSSPPTLDALEQTDVDRNGSLIDHICAIFTLLRTTGPITFLGGIILVVLICLSFALFDRILPGIALEILEVVSNAYHPFV